MDQSAEVLSEVSGRGKATLRSDDLNGEVTSFEESLCQFHALCLEPAIRSGPCCSLKAAGKGSRTHRCLGSKALNRQLLVEVALHPCNGLGKQV